MKKVKLKKRVIVLLINNANGYIDKVGRNADKLSILCSKIITYTPNNKFIKDHDKKVQNLKKKLDREIRDFSSECASLYLEGEKKNTFILNDKGNFTYTVENQKKLNSFVDKKNDKFEEELDELLEVEVDFYIDKCVDIPARLTIEFANVLELLIH